MLCRPVFSMLIKLNGGLFNVKQTSVLKKVCLMLSRPLSNVKQSLCIKKFRRLEIGDIFSFYADPV